MRSRFLVGIGLAVLLGLGLSLPVAAQPACQGLCNPMMDCRMPCYSGGYITCGDYHNCNADLDGDGILWWNDNCPMDYNPNQANCDGDSMGDICDPANEKWVYVSTDYNICYIDVDDHLLTQTLEAYGKQVYTNVCGVGGTCIKNYYLGGGECPRPLSSAFCCKQEMPTAICDAFLKKDKCGTPKCNF